MSFTVQASGSPSLNYQWIFHGTNLSDNVRISGALTSTLTISSVQTSDFGAYAVAVSNPIGGVRSSDAMLGPVAVLFSSIQLVGSNCALTFPAAAGATYQLQSSSSVVGPWTLLGTQTGTGGTNLFTVPVSPSPSMYFRLAAFAALSGVPNYSQNIVGYVNQQVVSGFTAVYNPFHDLTIEGALPSPPDGTEVFIWVTDHYNLYTFDGFLQAWDPTGSDLLPSGTNFIIMPASPFSFTFAGEVAPEVLNQPPIITSQPQSQVVLLGSNAVFSVVATGTQPLSYQWLHNAALLSDNSRIIGSQSNILSIANVGIPDGGSYQVLVANGSNTASSSGATLTVVSPQTVFYVADFEGAVGPEWSATRVSTTPVGARKFLGDFGNQTVSLSLSNLPPHGMATIDLDLFIIRSWDGNWTSAGPDIWSLQVANGPLLLRSTFGNGHPYSFWAGQAYPGSYPGGTFPDRSGATETNSLGYTFSDSAFTGPMDSVYHVSQTFAHSNGNLVVNFSGSGLQALTDESWGMDNVRVSLSTDSAGTLAFSTAGLSVPESAGSALVNVIRLGGAAGTVSVDYATSDGTANAGSDYVAVSGTLTFADGETNKTIAVPIINDTVPELSETFYLRLTNATGSAVLGTPASLQVTIIDDDGVIELAQTNFTVAECTAGLYIPVRWTGNTNQEVAVQYSTRNGTAVAGSDYFASSGTLIIPPGQTSGQVFIYVNDDGLAEADETFYVSLSNPSLGAVLGTQTNASIMILDNDTPTKVGEGVNWTVEALTVQPDGKFLVGGGFNEVNAFSRSAVARLNADGSVDTAFNPGSGANNWVEAVALQGDGKILIGGWFTAFNGTGRNRIARLNSNGSLDTTFDPGAGADNTVYKVAVQPDGKILLAGAFTTVRGTARHGIARLNPDGTLDATFDPGTGANNTIWGMGLQADGRVVVSGPFSSFNGFSLLRLARLNTNGSVDTTFNVGVGMNGRANVIIPLASGKLLMGGLFTTINGAPANRIARLNVDGTLDTNFNAGGPDSTVWSMSLQPDGKILVGGDWSTWNGASVAHLARLNTDGTVDPTFLIGQGVNGYVGAVRPLLDGRVAVAGYFTVVNGFNRYRLALLASDGSLPSEPVNWIQWPATNGGNGHWYALTSRPNDWTNAEAEAVSLGGHLVSISSAAEESFLEAIFLKGLNRIRPFWIGFSDAASESNFVWSSGESVTYTDWAAGEPNNLNNEDFAALNWPFSYQSGADPGNFGQWNDCHPDGTFLANQSDGPYFGIMELPNLSPQIAVQPQSQSVLAGTTASFDVLATGPGSLTYQWLLNGVSLVDTGRVVGSHTDHLVITNVQLADAGGYQVIVANNWGAVTSVVAALTVELPGGCVTPPFGLAAWWRGEGNATEFTGNHNGALMNGATFAPGEVGQAFSFNGTDNVVVPDAPDLNPASEITLETWVMLTGNQGQHRDIISKDGEISDREYLLTASSSDRFRAHIGVPSGLQYFDGATPVLLNTWYHVAMTFDGSSLKLFVNGNLDGSMAVTGPIIVTTQPVRIGGGAPDGTSQFYTPGLIDEPTIYSRALSPSEIAAIYQAGSSGKCLGSQPPAILSGPQSEVVTVGMPVQFQVVATGNPPPTYQWLNNGAPIPGATDATYFIGSVSLTDAGSYSVQVSNSLGSVMSSNALLTVSRTGVQPNDVPAFFYQIGVESSLPGQFQNPRGVATDGSGNLYVADTFNHRIQKFSANGTFIQQWGSQGTNAGQFDAPTGIAVDSFANVYVVEANNNRVQKFTSTGVYLAQWGSFGTNPAQFKDPRLAAVDTSGNFYVADRLNNRIQKFNSSGAFVYQIGTFGTNAGQFNRPRGVAVDQSGNIYVADWGNNRIQKFGIEGNYLAQWGTAGSEPGQFINPYGIAVGISNNVYVTDFGNDRVQMFDSAGNYRAQWGYTGNGAGQLNGPEGVAVDPFGSIYVADFNNSRVQKFTSAGVFVAELGNTSLPGRFNLPTGVALDSSNNLYVADQYNFRIQKFDPSGSLVTEWGSYGGDAGQFSYPASVAVGPSGTVYVADSGNGRIEKFDQSGNFLGQWYQGGSPGAIAVDANENVYVADQVLDAIQKSDSSGNLLLQWGSFGPDPGQFDLPGGVAVDRQGNVYVADVNNSRVQKFDGTGDFIEQWGSYGFGPGEFAYPFGIFVDSGGVVYVADTYNQRIQKFDSAGNFLAQWGSFGTGNNQFSYPQAIAVDATGNYIYVADSENFRIEVFAYGLPPVITVQPASQIAAVGDTVFFNVSATSSGAVSYQWLFNGAPIAGATDSSLVISNAAIVNSGNYQVTVSDPFGSVNSSNATLAVYTLPSITQPPISQQVSVGSPAVFTVVASSSGPLTYQWYFEGGLIPGATNTSYTIASAQFSDEGNYSVVVSGLAGSVTSPEAALIVVQPSQPPVVLPSYTIHIQAGMNLIANQLNRGGDTLLEIMPVVPDGTVLSKFNNASGTWSESTYNAALGAWVPPNIVLRPGEGAFLTSSNSFDLSLTGTPQIPVLPVLIPEGSAYLLSRQTNDIGTYQNIVGLAPAPGAVVYKWINSNATYQVFTYTVDGWSGGVEPTAAVGESMWIAPTGGSPVAIPVPPSITQQPVGLTVNEGTQASFLVQATGTQPLHYQWLLNGNGIPGATDSTFTIASVQATNTGSYSVVIDNLIGVVSSVAVTLTLSNETLLPFGDRFAVAGDLGSATSGSGVGSNVGVVTAPGVPSPLGLPGGAAVWLHWEPPVNGIATFTTAGSSFDTLLGAYTGTALSNLVVVAADDDSAPFLCSTITFNVQAGTVYIIQVEGFNAVQGNIALAWTLQPAPSLPPTILTQPQSQTVSAGSNATFSVVVQQDAIFSYQWYFNGSVVPGATTDTLDIPVATAAQVGFYSVAVTNTQSQAGVLSMSAGLQLIAAGAGQQGNPSDVSAQDKFSAATALTPPDPNIPHDPAPAGSFTGTQTFSTVGATTDPSEPNHCGYPPEATVWCSYISPASGLLTVDDRGSTFNAVIEVYTGSGVDFASLVPVACSANLGPGNESVTFTTTAGTTNWIVIGGINRSTGTAVINYTLSATPHFTVQPLSQTVSAGARLTLTTTVVGAPVLGYQWRLFGTNLPGATTSTLTVANFQLANQGDYSVVATNIYGTNFSVTASVYLNTSRFINLLKTATNFTAQFVGSTYTNYVFETSSNLVDWIPIRTNNSPIGIINFSDPTPGDTRFYRARRK